MLKNKTVVTAIVLIACFGSVLFIRALRPNPEVVLKQRIAERSVGSEKAPLWITEYFDYQCPPCATARHVLDGAIREHPGQIYLQARFFPLPAHKNGMKAARYAECAARQKGKFWKFHEELFKNQADWAMDDYAQIKFVSYAQSAELNLKELNACVLDPETEKAVIEEKKKGADLGVQITPSFFVNGKIVVGTNGLMDELKAYFLKEEKT